MGASEDKAPVRILHLSDIHFRASKAWDSDPVLKALARHIASEVQAGMAPDLVVFSGDLAFAGQASEYEMARSWLEERLWPALPDDFPREHLLMVPGNHDVDRDKISLGADALQLTLLAKGSQDTIAKVLAGDEDRSTMHRRLEAYLKFHANWHGEPAPFPWWQRTIDIRGCKIHIAGLDSAWMCSGDEDHGKLLVGRYQLSQVVETDEAEQADWRIAVMHHPWSYLAEFDGEELRPIVHQHCDLLLRGHLHATRPERIVPPDPGRACLELAAGCVYDNRQWPNGFQWIELSPGKDRVRVHLRNWTHSAWDIDRNYPGAENGVAEFHLEVEPPTAAPGIGVATVPQAYRDYLQRCHRTIELHGFEIQEGRSIVFRDIYVPALVRRKTEADEEDAKTRRTSRAHLSTGDGQDLEPLLARLAGHSLCVTAAAGAGKSTFCRWAVLHSAASPLRPHPIPTPEPFEEPATTLLNTRLPLLVELRDFWNDIDWDKPRNSWHCETLEKLLGNWADQHAAHGLDGELLLRHLQQGTTFLILDGFDEVPLSRDVGDRTVYPRQRLIDALKDAVPIWNEAGNRILITSRPSGFSGTAFGIESVDLAPMPEPMQTLFAERWFHALGKPEKASDLPQAIAKQRDLRDLAGNPLLMTALCVLYERGGKLPEDRQNLYTDIVHNVLYNRYPGEKSERTPVLARLEAIALGMHTGDAVGEVRLNPVPAVSTTEAERILAAFAKLNPTTESGRTEPSARLEELLSYSGLLLPRSNSRCAFYHFSIQEFLAARRLDLTTDEHELFSIFEERGKVAEWRLTLMFLFAARVMPRDGNRILDFLARLTASHERRSVRNNPASAVLHAEMIDECLARRHALPEEFSERFKRLCLDAIEDEIELSARHALALTLGRLGDPRILHPRDPAGYVEIAAGTYPYGDEREMIEIAEPFRIGRYPVTNQQYRLFIEDGGYERRELWSDEGWAWREGQKVSEPNSDWWQDRRWNGANQPVVGVSWHEAAAFCAWAGVRLPHEREWEAAARGKAGLEYPWGNEWASGLCNTRETGLGVTSPVGLFPGSRQKEHGLEDMAGNVLEWCANRYEEKSSSRVVRGGSWNFYRDDARCADRYHDDPNNRFVNLGFRVVCSSPIFDP